MPKAKSTQKVVRKAVYRFSIIDPYSLLNSNHPLGGIPLFERKLCLFSVCLFIGRYRSAIVESAWSSGQRISTSYSRRRRNIPYKENEKIFRLGLSLNSHRLLIVFGGTGLAGGLLRLAVILLSSSLGNSLSIFLVLVNCPVKYIIILKPLPNKKIAEDLSQIAVVRLVIKAQGASVVQIDGELVGKASAKNLGRSCHLLFHDSIVLLFFGGSLQTLPGQRATAEVEHNIAKRLHIITARLF